VGDLALESADPLPPEVLVRSGCGGAWRWLAVAGCGLLNVWSR
jgi:hypothetical protein